MELSVTSEYVIGYLTKDSRTCCWLSHDLEWTRDTDKVTWRDRDELLAAIQRSTTADVICDKLKRSLPRVAKRRTTNTLAMARRMFAQPQQVKSSWR